VIVFFFYTLGLFFSFNDGLIFFCADSHVVDDAVLRPIAVCNGFTVDDIESRVRAAISMG
jgi:hypothetical protein